MRDKHGLKPIQVICLLPSGSGLSHTLARPQPNEQAANTPLWQIVNAIFYVLRTGCAWRMPSHDFPPWTTAHHSFPLWRLDGTWERINAGLRTDLDSDGAKRVVAKDWSSRLRLV